MSDGFSHISETALWVAMHRALESDRRDSHFKDPYARILAGSRGKEILKRTPYARTIAWSTIVRTCLIDEIILRLVNERKIGCVVNLAAGLDARPYRLILPAELTWIEVDLPDILLYKEDMLRDFRPDCHLERRHADLRDESVTETLFSEIAALGGTTLVLTEGLLIYLTREQVIALAGKLVARPQFHYWLSDLASPVVLEFGRKTFGKKMHKGGFEMQFAPREGKEFFRPIGWNPLEFRSMAVESERLDRKMPLSWMWKIAAPIFYSREKREQFTQTGVVLLERAN